MTTYSFTSFKEAAAFTKKIARERKESVAIVRRGVEFVVESNASLSPPTTQQPQLGHPVSSPRAPKPPKPLKPLKPPQLPKPSNSPKTISVSSSTNISVDARLCIDCPVVIPAERIENSPKALRCLSCQELFEKENDTRQRANMGFTGPVPRGPRDKMRDQFEEFKRNKKRRR